MNYFNKQIIAISTVATFSFAAPAFAIDAQDFADKLSETVSLMTSTQVNFNNVEVKGDNVIVKGINIPELTNDASKPLIESTIIFEGVTENGDGSYSIENASFEDINYIGDDVNIKVNDISLSKILISANPLENILDTMKVYQEFKTGSILISYEDDEYVKVDSVTASIIPTDDIDFVSQFAINGLYIDLTKIDDEEAEEVFSKLGVNAIDGNIIAQSTWTTSNGRITIDEFSIDLKNIGRLNITMELLGYTLDVVKNVYTAQKQLLEIDPSSAEYEAKTMEMLMSIVSELSFVDFSFSFADGGITNKAIDYIAAEQGSDRKQFVDGISAMAPALLAEFNVPDLQAQVGEAVSVYLNDPQNFEIKVAPSNPAPLMAFMALASNPPALLAMINLSIKANQ